MKQTSGSIILRQDDYELLIAYLKNNRYAASRDAQNVQDLKAELRRAMLVSKESFPEDVIRLNSKIKIKDAGKNNIMELMLVMPDKADLRQKRISVMAPVGTALIGFRKGQKVSWQVPAGKRTFHIVDVVNDSRTIAGS
ncbi:MAG TPA: GreA/GreB family elongation factor [Parafilimonas sp.]|nr:GreA/GreB family elongation factor [Parafilimonas sp.]